MRVGKVDSAIIYGIQKNYLYCLRVLGFSIGGDGTMSELVYFTLGEDSISSINSLNDSQMSKLQCYMYLFHGSKIIMIYTVMYFLYTTDFSLLEYCRDSVKHKTIDQSYTQENSIFQLICSVTT